MILNIIIYDNGKDAKPADELRLEADNFLIESVNGIAVENNQDTKDKNWEDIKTTSPNDMFCCSNPPLDNTPYWRVSHNKSTYVFQVAYLTNNEGKTIHKYG